MRKLNEMEVLIARSKRAMEISIERDRLAPFQELCEMKYPTPWGYDAGNMWITRETNSTDGEIWCEFKEPPDEDELAWLLGVMNEADGV